MQLIITLILTLLIQEGIHANGCPSNEDEWQSRLESLATSLIPNLGNNGLYKRGPKLLPKERYEQVLSFWNTCKSHSNKSVQKKFKNILKHSHFMFKSQAQGHSGFKISDEDHLLSSLSKNMQFALIPKIFFKDDYLPSNWEKIIKKCNHAPNTNECNKIKMWKIIEFSSTLEDGSGKHRRVIVQIPHKNFQQYLLFFPDHVDHKVTKLTDIIALQTHDLKTHEPLKKPLPHFFERHKKGFAKDGGRCISCHTNGLREIYPIQGSVIESQQAQIISAFNKEVRNYGSPDWSGLVEYSALGPGMGKSCIQCHSINKERAPLTIFTKPSLIRSKIHEHEMPRPDLFKAYFDQIRSIPTSLDKNQKAKIKKLALSHSAMPGKDYRTNEEIKMVRLKIQQELLKQGHIGYLKYYYIRGLDYFGSLYSDYKLSSFFHEYKKDLFQWLIGSP